jgi:hypothetical protein
VVYSKEHIENYLPSKWGIKLITKKGDNIVSKEKISSASDIVGDRIQKFKVKKRIYRKSYDFSLF